MSGIVVGIDPSLTATGLAVLENGEPRMLSTFGRTLHDQAGYGQRAARMTYTVTNVLRAVPRDAELVVIEGMSYDSNLPGHHDVVGLWWHLMTHLFARGAAIAVVPPSTLKVWATGKAGKTADKQAMLAAAQLHFPDLTVRNADQADALHCASLGAARLGHELPFPAERRHRYNVDAVAWPDGLPPIPTCPDCGHDRSDTQGAHCMAEVKRRGRRDYCGCTTLALSEKPEWTAL